MDVFVVIWGRQLAERGDIQLLGYYLVTSDSLAFPFTGFEERLSVCLDAHISVGLRGLVIISGDTRISHLLTSSSPSVFNLVFEIFNGFF